MQLIHLLKPQVLSILASTRHKGFEREARQSALILGFCLILAASLYFGSRHVIVELARFSHLAYLPVSHILGLFLLVLFFTLIISNLATALGRFYQSRDTDLLLSSPISFTTLFILRTTLVFVSASWMPALFLTPVILGVLGPYALTISQFACIIPLLLCFFLIPTGIAILVATLVLYVSPTNYVRYILLSLALLVSYSVWQLHDTVVTENASLINAQGIIRMISVMSLHQIDWLPGNWMARSIESILNGTFSFLAPECLMLFGSALFIISLAYVILLLFFDEALARSSGANARAAGTKRFSFRTLFSILPCSIQTRSIVAKEYQLLLRDTAQLVQVALLFILSSLYLYNLETLAFASQFSDRFNQNWSNFMSVTTVSIGCFFTIAVATRIVFPSLSLEGPVINLLQSAPIKMETVLRIKFWIWFIPLSVLSVSFFTLGGYAIHLSPLPHCLIALFGLISAYNSVGLAIGLGAKFSRFDWEYSTQLAASFGSVFYMLTTVATISVSGFLLLPLAFQINRMDTISLRGYLLVAAALILASLPGIIAVECARRAGLQELRERAQR